MVAETTVAESIRIVDQKAAYDAACKRVLAEKIILAWVMKEQGKYDYAISYPRRKPGRKRQRKRAELRFDERDHGLPW